VVVGTVVGVTVGKSNGVGLGTVWGRQKAEQMLAEAGLVDIDAMEIRTDPFNYYYVAHRPGHS